MQIFQRNILNKYIEGLDNTLIDERYKTFSSFFLDPERQANILNSKEEQFQEGFLRELFVKILGYTLNPDPNFNLTTEKKNETNSKKADGAILVDGKVVGVIELKDHKTPDLSKVEAQAFNYKSQHKEALYVVISNFEKLRFYIDNAVDFEEFDLFHLTRDDFARLWICLAYENIAKNLPKQIKAASLTNEDQITNALYKDYSNFKRDLFEDILKNNPTDDTEHKILLFKKTQKLLDRLLFIFFAEDRGLLPPNSIMLIINQWEKLKDLDEYQPFYNRLKKYFGYMNTGFQGKNYEVFAYNGGLFKPDEILNGLTISDEVLMRYCKKISDYDFQSDVDVNILGHIFENSLTEIEEVTARLSTVGHDPLAQPQPIAKRKKDGVFYTPQYITKYIVENTVGKLCREKKAELGIDESEYFTDKKRQVATKKALIEKLEAYRNWLLQISICDPACGSGAFLNAALNFLIAEHKLIDEMQAKVEGASLVFPNVENSILENNLYGVDINEESVEIAKLSLWLRTAKPHRKLNSLNDNIKCGNSLIDDPAIAGDKAFCWEKEFPKVFREKQKRPWHITTAVHDSRTSERMIEYEVRRLRDNGTRPYPEPMLLSEEEEIIITETVAKIVEEDKLNVLAYNICFDHMHLLLVCEEEEVPKIVGKIKSMTARAVNIAMGRTIPATENQPTTATRGHAPLTLPDDENQPTTATAGHDPLTLPDASLPDPESLLDENLPKKGLTQCSLWTRKYGTTYIDSEEHLYNAIEYIRTNREHHDLPPLNVEYPRCVTIEEAFQPEYTGGFDVVIGNPPYGAQLTPIEQEHIENKYKLKCTDTACLFMGLALNIVKGHSPISYIIPKPFLYASNWKTIRSVMLPQITSIIDCSKVWSEVKLEQIIFNAVKGSETQCYDSFKRIESDFQLVANIDKSLCQKFDFYLNGVSAEEIQIAEKMLSFGTFLNDFASNQRGAMYQKEVVENQSDYKVFGGKQVGRYYTKGIKGYISNESIKEEKGKIKNNSVLAQNIIAFIENPYPHIKIIATITKDKDDIIILDTINQLSVNEEFDNRYILSIINSNLLSWYVYRFIFGLAIRTMHFDNAITERIPIPAASSENQQPFIAHADQMLSLIEQLQQKRQRFLHRMEESLGVQKITAALERFDEADFAALLAELKKQKISLTLVQKDEWEDYFTQYKAACNALTAQITATDKEIDRLVYDLYALTPDEIKVVEGE